MNRRDRRRAEAQDRKRFEEYRDLYRKAYRSSTDREIGEGFMRGEAVSAGGFTHMVIHPTSKSPPPPSDDDLWLSVAYGPQRFLACTANQNLSMLAATWPDFIRQLREQRLAKPPLITDDERHDAREFIFSMVVDNHAQSDSQYAALTASAMAWLIATSPIGVTFGEAHKVAHYEITNQEALSASGRRARNFRLALMNDLSELALLQNMPPPPQW
jgi:hypothetical protein